MRLAPLLSDHFSYPLMPNLVSLYSLFAAFVCCVINCPISVNTLTILANSVVYISLFYYFESFSQQSKLMVSHWSLSDSKSSLVSRILLNILTDLYNAVVWMVSACPLISKSSSPFINPMGIVSSTPIIIGTTVKSLYQSFGDCTDHSNYNWYHRQFHVP